MTVESIMRRIIYGTDAGYNYDWHKCMSYSNIYGFYIWDTRGAKSKTLRNVTIQEAVSHLRESLIDR